MVTANNDCPMYEMMGERAHPRAAHHMQRIVEHDKKQINDNNIQRIELSDEEFGEGEIEDTQFVKNTGLSLEMKQQMKREIEQTADALSITPLSSHDKNDGSNSKRKHRKRNRSSLKEYDGANSKLSQPFDPKAIKLPPFKSIYDKATLETFPQRTRWAIPDSKIVFSSEFCSGNLAKAQRGFQKNSFDLWVCGDAQPNTEGDYYKTWFYFSVTGMPQGELVTFTFKNLNNQSKLYNQGLKPVFKVMPNQQKKFRRIMTKVQTYFNNDDQFTMQFSHMFAYPENCVTYFAFTFPFSYQETIELTDDIENRLQNQPNIYFNREILTYSLEGRPMELLTISSQDQITEEREGIPTDGKGLFPAAEIDIRSRPLRFKKEKPVIFMTSRVHPGETPGSHVLNGFLELLTDLKCEQGRLLRKNYVFKVIMVLNPDGVSRGYYRLDSTASNLNRFYLNPSKFDQPTIWACKKAVVQQAEEYKCLKMFIDFHAHASKKGGFMFGNHIVDQEKQADNITFVKLIAMNCLNFDMNECNFSDKIMAIKDRNGQSREGSSRVAIAKATGLTYCYTLEFNYHSGKRINTLAPKYNKMTGGIDPETEVTDPGSKIYVNQSSPPFTQQIFEDCGRAVGSALLDLIDDNPISRIPLSCYRTVNNVRTDILNNLQKYESGNVNVVGANHFAPTNTKVAKAFANTPGPRIKLGNGSAGTVQQKAEHERLKKAASLLSNSSNKNNRGTFGISKRIMDDNNSSSVTQSQPLKKVTEKRNTSGRGNNQLSGKSRQNSGINSSSQQPVSRHANKASLQPNSAKQMKSNKKQRGSNLFENAPEKDHSMPPKSKMKGNIQAGEKSPGNQWIQNQDGKLAQYQAFYIQQELQNHMQGAQPDYQVLQRNLMSQTSQNQILQQKPVVSIHPNYTVQAQTQQPPPFLTSQHQIINVSQIGSIASSKYASNNSSNAMMGLQKNLPMQAQALSKSNAHNASQRGQFIQNHTSMNQGKCPSPQNMIRNQEKNMLNSLEASNLQSAQQEMVKKQIQEYQQQVIMQKQQQIQYVREQFRLQQKMHKETTSAFNDHPLHDQKVNQSFSYNQGGKNITLDQLKEQQKLQMFDMIDNNLVSLPMTSGTSQQKLQLLRNLPTNNSNLLASHGHLAFQNGSNQQTRSKSHIKSDVAIDLTLVQQNSHQPKNQKQSLDGSRRLKSHQSPSLSSKHQNEKLHREQLQEKGLSMPAEIEQLTQPKISTKSKTTDKSIGRRSARQKNRGSKESKKGSIGALIQDKQKISGASKLDAIKLSRGKCDGQNLDTKHSSPEKPTRITAIPKISLDNMDQSMLTMMRHENQHMSQSKIYGTQSQSLMTDNHLPNINQAYLQASGEKQSSGRHTNSMSQNSKDMTIQHSSSRQHTSIPLLVPAQASPAQSGLSPIAKQPQIARTELMNQRTGKHLKPPLVQQQLQTTSQMAQSSAQHAQTTQKNISMIEHRKNIQNNVSKGQLQRNGFFSHVQSEGTPHVWQNN